MADDSKSFEIGIKAAGGDAAAAEVKKVTAATEAQTEAQKKSTAASSAAVPALEKQTQALERRANVLAKNDAAAAAADEKWRASTLNSGAGAPAVGGSTLPGAAEAAGMEDFSARGAKQATAAGAAIAKVITDVMIKQAEQEEVTRRQTDALTAQLDQWRQVASSARSMNDVASLSREMLTNLDGMRNRLAEAPTSQGLLDGLKEVLNMTRMMNLETTDAKGQREGEQRLKNYEQQVKTLTQQAVEAQKELKRIEELPLPERIETLTEKLNGYNAASATMEVGTRQWLEQKEKIDATTDALKKATTAKNAYQQIEQRDNQDWDNQKKRDSDQFDKDKAGAKAQAEAEAEDVKQRDFRLNRSAINDADGPAGNEARKQKQEKEQQDYFNSHSSPTSARPPARQPGDPFSSHTRGPKDFESDRPNFDEAFRKRGVGEIDPMAPTGRRDEGDTMAGLGQTASSDMEELRKKNPQSRGGAGAAASAKGEKGAGAGGGENIAESLNKAAESTKESAEAAKKLEEEAKNQSTANEKSVTAMEGVTAAAEKAATATEGIKTGIEKLVTGLNSVKSAIDKGGSIDGR